MRVQLRLDAIEDYVLQDLLNGIGNSSTIIILNQRVFAFLNNGNNTAIHQ